MIRSSDLETWLVLDRHGPTLDHLVDGLVPIPQVWFHMSDPISPIPQVWSHRSDPTDPIPQIRSRRSDPTDPIPQARSHRSDPTDPIPQVRSHRSDPTGPIPQVRSHRSWINVWWAAAEEPVNNLKSFGFWDFLKVLVSSNENNKGQPSVRGFTTCAATQTSTGDFPCQQDTSVESHSDQQNVAVGQTLVDVGSVGCALADCSD